MPIFGIPLDFGSPLETFGAPLALVVLILMGSRLSRPRTRESRDIAGMLLLVIIVAAGFFWVSAALGLLSKI